MAHVGRPPIALIGIMGSGKSAVATVLARLLGGNVVDIDHEIERDAQASVAQLFVARGEPAFRDLEEQALRRAVEDGATVIACGGGVVLRPSCRLLLRERCHTVWLETSPRRAAERIGPDGATRPMLAGEDPEARLAELLAERTPLYSECAHARVTTDDHTPELVAEAVLATFEAAQGGAA